MHFTSNFIMLMPIIVFLKILLTKKIHFFKSLLDCQPTKKTLNLISPVNTTTDNTSLWAHSTLYTSVLEHEADI